MSSKLNFDQISHRNLMNMGNLYEKKGNEEKIHYYYNQAIQKYQNKEAMFRLGQYYYLKKIPDKAITYLEMAIEHNHVKAMVLMGLYHKQNKDYDNAIKYYVLATEFKNPIAYYALGALYHKFKNYSLMLAYYELAGHYGNSDALVELGLYYKKKKNDELTKKYLLLAVKKNNVDAMFELANFYKKKKQMDLYTKYLWYAVYCRDGEVSAMIELGDYYKMAGNYKKMEIYYRMAIKKKSAEAMYELGDYYYEPFGDRSKNERALYYFSLCLDTDETYINAYWMAGKVCLEMGLVRTAEKFLLSGIKHNHEDCCYHYACDLCYKIKKDYPLAIEYAQLSIEKHNDPRSMILLGDYHKKNRNYKKMEGYYSLAIECNDPFDRNKKGYEKFGIYLEYIEKDFVKAQEYYEKSGDNELIKNINIQINNLALVTSKCNKIKNESCKICSDETNDCYQLQLCCKHNLCIGCISGILNRYLNFRCPYCRFELELENPEKYVRDDVSSIDHNYISGIYYENEIIS